MELGAAAWGDKTVLYVGWLKLAARNLRDSEIFAFM
jgi:hypothetical protein